MSIVFSFENPAVCNVTWKNTVQSVRQHDKMGHAHCMLDT